MCELVGTGVALSPTEGMGQHSPGFALWCPTCAAPRGCTPSLEAEGGDKVALHWGGGQVA